MCKIKLSDGPKKDKKGELILDDNVNKVFDHIYSEQHKNSTKSYSYCSDLDNLNIYNVKTGNYLCPVCKDENGKQLVIGTKENCMDVIKHFDSDKFKECEKKK